MLDWIVNTLGLRGFLWLFALMTWGSVARSSYARASQAEQFMSGPWVGFRFFVAAALIYAVLALVWYVMTATSGKLEVLSTQFNQRFGGFIVVGVVVSLIAAYLGQAGATK